MPRCANKSCQTANGKRAKLPKGTLPQICSDACQKAVIAEAIAKSNAMAKRAIKKAQNTKALEEKAARKQARRRKQEFVANDYSKQFQLTKRAAQALANALDKDLPCICCSTPRGSAQFCGGHFKTAGAHPELALDLLNIHGQRNFYCNQNKSGNIEGDKHSHGYKRGLVARYGQWIVDYLDGYHPPRKYTCEELIAMRKEFAADTRRIKQGLAPLKDWRALPESVSRPMEKVA